MDFDFKTKLNAERQKVILVITLLILLYYNK